MMSQEERVRILREAPPDSWIALSADESRLVAIGESYSDAVDKAEKAGENDPVLIKQTEYGGIGTVRNTHG